MFDPPETRFINCEHCGTEGRIYSGDGPHPTDCGPCPVCNGECVEEVEVEPITLDDLEDDDDDEECDCGEDTCVCLQGG